MNKQLNKAAPKPPREMRINIFKSKETGQVVLDFGRDVSWVGFTPKQAKEIAQMILKQAGEN